MFSSRSTVRSSSHHTRLRKIDEKEDGKNVKADIYGGDVCNAKFRMFYMYIAGADIKSMKVWFPVQDQVSTIFSVQDPLRQFSEY